MLHGSRVQAAQASSQRLQEVHDHDGAIELHMDAELGEDATFSVASTKKELKELQKSGADIIYDERKGKLYLNGNGESKGWGIRRLMA